MKRLRLIQMFLLLFLAVGTYAVEPISGYFGSVLKPSCKPILLSA